MEKLNSNIFLKAFKKEWENQISSNKDLILDYWSDSSKWTDFMLKKQGFIHSILHHFGKLGKEITYAKEWYTIDAVYCGGIDLYGSDLNYPSKFFALIEHEQGNYIEQEMWKLLHWRSPLKIIIFYDWFDSDKSTTNRKEWVDNKLKKLQNMLFIVNEFHTENPETEYLFIVGHCKSEGNLPTWSYSTNKRIEKIEFIP